MHRAYRGFDPAHGRQGQRQTRHDRSRCPRRSALRGRTGRFYASPLAEETYSLLDRTVEAGERVGGLPPCRFSAV